jgi:hypothetical protein
VSWHKPTNKAQQTECTHSLKNSHKQTPSANPTFERLPFGASLHPSSTIGCGGATGLNSAASDASAVSVGERAASSAGPAAVSCCIMLQKGLTAISACRQMKESIN